MTPTRRLKILLADDGSEHAGAAVELLQELPLPPKTSIRVLRAFAPAQIDWLPTFEKSLARSQEQLSSRGYRVETELTLGSAPVLILTSAATWKADLIVLGAKGLRSTMNILLGGVAQQVMEHAPCPILIVRAPFRGFRRVLLAVDGSPSSRSAVRYLGKFPLPEETVVHVIHALPPHPVPLMMDPYAGAWHTVYAPMLDAEDNAILRRQETEWGQRLLQRTCTALQNRGISPVTALVRGDAATEIMKYARDNEIELIVAGSTGMSNFKSLWVGSVSRKLVHYSDCSVLLVKVPEKE